MSSLIESQVVPELFKKRPKISRPEVVGVIGFRLNPERRIHIPHINRHASPFDCTDRVSGIPPE